MAAAKSLLPSATTLSLLLFLVSIVPPWAGYSMLATALHDIDTIGKCIPTQECMIVNLELPSKTSHSCSCIDTLIISSKDSCGNGQCPTHIVLGQNATISSSVQIDISSPAFKNTSIELQLEIVHGSMAVHLHSVAKVKELKFTPLWWIGGGLIISIDGELELLSFQTECYNPLTIGDAFTLNGGGYVKDVSMPFVGRVGRHGLSSDAVSFQVTVNVDRLFVNVESTRAYCPSDPIDCSRTFLEVYGAMDLHCPRENCTFALRDVSFMFASIYHNISSLPGTMLEFFLISPIFSVSTMSPIHFSVASTKSLLQMYGAGEFQTIDNPAYPQNIIDFDPRYNATLRLEFGRKKSIIVTESVTETSCNGQGVPKNDGSGICTCFGSIPDGKCESFPYVSYLNLYLFDQTLEEGYIIDRLDRVDLDDEGRHYVFVGQNIIVTNKQDESRLTSWRALYINDKNTHSTQLGQTPRSFTVDQFPRRFIHFDTSYFNHIIPIQADHKYVVMAFPAIFCFRATIKLSFQGIGDVLANATKFGTYSDAPYFQGGSFPISTTTATTTISTSSSSSTGISSSTLSTTMTKATSSSTSTSSSTPTSSTTIVQSMKSNDATQAKLIAAVVGVVCLLGIIILVVHFAGKRRSNASKDPQQAIVLQQMPGGATFVVVDGVQSRITEGSIDQANIGYAKHIEEQEGEEDEEDGDKKGIKRAKLYLDGNVIRLQPDQPKQTNQKQRQRNKGTYNAFPTTEEFFALLARDDAEALQNQYYAWFENGEEEEGTDVMEEQSHKLGKSDYSSVKPISPFSTPHDTNNTSTASTPSTNPSTHAASQGNSMLSFFSALSPPVPGNLDSMPTPSSHSSSNHHHQLKGRFADIRFEDNSTMLMRAIMLNARDCLPMIAAMHPSLGLTNNRNESVLHLLCSEYCEEKTREKALMHLFNEHNIGSWVSVDLNAYDADGFTPLMRAVRNGFEDMVAFLVKHGANPLLCVKDTEGVEHVDDHVNGMLRTGQSVTVKEGYNSISTAICYHNSHLLDVMLTASKCGQSLLQALDWEGNSALHHVVVFNAGRCVLPILRVTTRLLFVKGGKERRTPLHLAIALDVADVAKEIVTNISSTLFKRLLLEDDASGQRVVEAITHVNVGDVDDMSGDDKEFALKRCFALCTLPSSSAALVVMNNFCSKFQVNDAFKQSLFHRHTTRINKAHNPFIQEQSQKQPRKQFISINPFQSESDSPSLSQSSKDSSYSHAESASSTFLPNTNIKINGEQAQDEEVSDLDAFDSFSVV
eukprot:m.35684 g.35684  ORF g.35684 m.35684 type:complete len:1274 (-) comp6621_c0_seq1:403-4224(-)